MNLITLVKINLFSFSAMLFLSINQNALALKFCYEEQDSPPWVMKNKTGVDIEFMELLSKATQEKFDLEPLPWKRCLIELGQNHYDGAFASSYKKERLENGFYPTTDGTLNGPIDETKKIHISEYSFYVLKEKEHLYSWDGKTSTGIKIAGTMPGFSVTDTLKKLKISVDEGGKSPELIFEKLIHGRIDAAALQTPRGDWFLNKTPSLKKIIVKIKAPIEIKAYYLMLSKKFVSEEPKKAKRIWDEIPKIYHSDSFKKILEKYNQ